ncbi:hypothetical protein HDU87_003058 [Geranomyces variabilis]|uniref:HAMP domain-containing protein n=1 Tax=Geranomyces variabilis TaxID=109894 RepID=A0AAD5XNC9_9FUNG|nr:hypothetical protein HDU87_003058 [Geranomyces variabilis]
MEAAKTPLNEEDAERGQRLQIDEKRQLFRGKEGISWTVRLSLVLPFLLAIVFSLIGVAVTLIWVSSLNNIRDYTVSTAQETISALATDLLTSTGSRVDTSIETFLAEKVEAVNVVDSMKKIGLLRPPSLDEYYQAFFSMVRQNIYISTMAYADAEQMTYLAITRPGDGYINYELVLNSNATCIVCNRTSTPPGMKVYSNASMDGVPGPQVMAKPYDFRARPWYVNCTRANATIWTDPYPFTNGALGVSLVMPVYSTKTPGAIAGAYHLDVTIAPLSLFLKNIVALEGGYASLVTHDNKLFASASDQPLDDGHGALLSAFTSQDPFTNRTIVLVNQDQSTGNTNATIKDSRYWFTYQSFKSADASTPSFLVTSISGREAVEYTAPVDNLAENFQSVLVSAIRTSAIITTAFIVAGFLFILAFVFGIILRPLEDLQDNMMKATKFDFFTLLETASSASRLSEINMLQYVFRKMISAFASTLQANAQMTRRGDASTSGRQARSQSVSQAI